jgi:Na+/H+-dicarboxylate symporter
MPPSVISINSLTRIVRHPAVTVSAVIFALVLGLTQAPFLQKLRPFGDFYLALLQMFVLPFLLVTIPLAVRSAMTSHTVGPMIRLLAFWALIALAAVAVTSILVPSLVFHFYTVDESLLARIGGFVGGSTNRIDLEFPLDPGRASVSRVVAESGLVTIIPTNIFAALSSNDSMRVLVFCAVFGVGLVIAEHPTEHSVFASMRHVQKVCVLVFDWFSLLVPVGVVALIAPPVAQMGSEIFIVLRIFAYGFLAASSVILICAITVVALILKRSPLTVLSSMLKPMMLGAATTNTMVCIPASLEIMTDELRVPSGPCELFIPVGFATLRFGTMIYFIVATLFMATLMGRQLSGMDLISVAVLSAAASFATLGAAGLAALQPLAVVLRSFGLSYELAVPLMIIIDPIANMIRTMLNVAVNCTIPALAAGRSTEALVPVPAE